MFAALRRPNRAIWFFILSWIIVLLLSFDTALAKSIYSLNIPLISTAVPTRLMFIFCFSSSVLAAFGFDLLEKSKRRDKRLLLSLSIIGSVFVILWGFVYSAQNFFSGQPWLSNLDISKRNLILPTGIFSLGVFFVFLAYTFKEKLKGYILIALIILTVFDLFYFFQKITPFSPVESVYPKTEVLTQVKKLQGIDRFWGYGSGYLEPNIQTYEKIFSTDGYDALHIKDYSELVSSSSDGRVSNLSRSETEIVRGFGEEDLRTNVYRQNILNLLGVKYILHKVSASNLSPDKTFNDSIYKLIWQKGNWQIYENKQALSRVSLFANYVVEKDKKEIIRKIHDPAFNLKETVILEEDLSQNFRISEDKNSKVEVQSYKPNEIIINTSSTGDSILFLSDIYYLGWEAAVDDISGKIYRADYAFRAVAVPKGNHTVVFSYHPESYNLGLKITSVSLLFILLLSISKAIRIKKQTN